MGTVYTSPKTLDELLKHEYSRETCREVVTIAASATDYEIGTILGKKADGTLARCIANAEGTTAVKTVNATATASVGTEVGDAAAYLTFAGIAADLSQKDRLSFKYEGTVYSCALPSGTLNAAALNTAVDGAKDSSGTALGADKITASFGGTDNVNLILTADSNAKTLTDGVFTDVDYAADSTGEHVAVAVLIQRVPASANAVADVLVLAHGPAIVADKALVYDASVNSDALKLAKREQLSAVGIVTREAV